MEESRPINSSFLPRSKILSCNAADQKSETPLPIALTIMRIILNNHLEETTARLHSDSNPENSDSQSRTVLQAPAQIKDAEKQGGH